MEKIFEKLNNSISYMSYRVTIRKNDIYKSEAVSTRPILRSRGQLYFTQNINRTEKQENVSIELTVWNHDVTHLTEFDRLFDTICDHNDKKPGVIGSIYENDDGDALFIYRFHTYTEEAKCILKKYNF